MNALVLKEYGRFSFEGVAEPELNDQSVLIDIKACAICGSDVHGMDGSTGRRQPPVIMGHEASGEIVATGADVTEWKAGDRVTFDSTIYCGDCHFCKSGHINLCDNRRVLGVSCDEYRQDGAFADYIAIPQHILYRLPDGADFVQAAMVEPVSIAVHAAKRAALAEGDIAVVVGTGMIGLLVVQVLKAYGCKQVIAVDIDPAKLEVAASMGADVTLNAESVDVPAEITTLTGGRGADVAFEVVGATAPITTALESLRKGGKLVLVGNISPKIDLPLQSVVTREITLLGSCFSH